MGKKVPDQHIERANLENLKELVDYAAKAYKENIAFRYRAGEEVIDVTFNQFKSDVYAFMAYLFKNGIKDGQRVALLGENSYEWIVTYFAVVNCGNVIVPIDKELKPNEISTLLNDSESVLLVYSKAKENSVKTMQESGIVTEKFLCIENFSDALAEGNEYIKEGNDDYKSVEIDKEIMCAIIYTSGTTGDPKGVMLSHKNLARDAYLAMSCMIIPDTTIAIIPLNHTFGFMASILCQIWMGHSVFINNNLKTILKRMPLLTPRVMEQLFFLRYCWIKR